MLKLEFTCTDAEIREAKSLNLRQELGRGSGVRAQMTLFAILILVVALGYFQLREMFGMRYWPWMLAAFGVIFFFFYYQQIRVRKKPKKPAKVELTENGIVFSGDNIQISHSWAGFAQCLESPNLFVLVDKPKSILLIFPKRVFPDEKTQEWFRANAGQKPNLVASTMEKPFSPGSPGATDGIVLTFQLSYRDYLNRLLSSWRTRGLLIALYLFITGIFVYDLIRPPADAVVSPLKVYFVYTLPIFTTMLIFILPVVAFVAWRAEFKYLLPRRLVLKPDCIEFATDYGNGVLPWMTYQYYMENRWSFFVWDFATKQWDMYPKSAFSSPADIECCRELLKTRLRPSRWFFL